ncbi:hypothetical protein KQX54_020926 [Cotesia glomerata]|uniref:Uncharacterized protein n=1 Tax=Cotesia glomerata TaxID=32391 RepID=A0AAV7IGF8_COTGL|nr:hypothetical protein KQX54_020926 [Cotesia glomerata]
MRCDIQLVRRPMTNCEAASGLQQRAVSDNVKRGMKWTKRSSVSPEPPAESKEQVSNNILDVDKCERQRSSDISIAGSRARPDLAWIGGEGARGAGALYYCVLLECSAVSSTTDTQYYTQHTGEYAMEF